MEKAHLVVQTILFEINKNPKNEGNGLSKGFWTASKVDCLNRGEFNSKIMLQKRISEFTVKNSKISNSRSLKGKSGVVIIVDYSRDYSVVNDVKYFFQSFSLLICETTYFNLIRSVK